MFAGLPGAGIGGLFYLISALALPVRALARAIRGHPMGLTPGAVLRQVLIALGILAGIWATGWLLGLMVAPGLVPPPSSSRVLRAIPGASANVVRIAAVLVGFATLGIVLLSVEVARLVVRRSVRRSPRVGANA